MKIVFRKDVSGWEHPCVCEGCESKLIIESKDLRYSRDTGARTETSYERFSAICTVCNTIIFVPSNAVPKLIKIELINKYDSDRGRQTMK